MNRGYTSAHYVEKVERLRSVCPDIAISADCIVGFPGEDERDFEATLRLIRQVGFDGIFSFCYSPRKYTSASTLPDMVSRAQALERLKQLQALQKSITRERFRSLEGTRAEVLVEGASKNSADELTGRTRTNRIVNFTGSPDMIGKLVDVEVVKGYANSLRGAEPKFKEA